MRQQGRDRHARRLPGYAAARAAWLHDLKRDPTPNRIRRFGQALVLARELPPWVGHLHAHFLHTPPPRLKRAFTLTGISLGPEIWEKRRLRRSRQKQFRICLTSSGFTRANSSCAGFLQGTA